MKSSVALSKYTTKEFARAQKAAHQRLHPSIFAANYLVLSNRRAHMEMFFARMDSVGKVLDVGAQYCPYYPFFQHKCLSYTSLDVVETPMVDIVCNAEQMEVEDCSFDLILCTQVLEHTHNPQRVVDECHRVLKPGGTLILAVPSVFPVHGYPGDYWRFMPDGLHYLLRSFSQTKVLGELDFAESAANVTCYYGHVLTGRMGRVGKAIDPFWHLFTNIMGRVGSMLLSPFARSNFTSFTTNLWAVAQK